MSKIYKVVLRANSNYPRADIEKTLITVLGKDFFKKFPLLIKGKFFDRAVQQVFEGDYIHLPMGQAALDRLLKINAAILGKGHETIVSVVRKDSEFRKPTGLVLADCTWDTSCYLFAQVSEGTIYNACQVSVDKVDNVYSLISTLQLFDVVMMHDDIVTLLGKSAKEEVPYLKDTEEVFVIKDGACESCCVEDADETLGLQGSNSVGRYF